MPDLVVEEYKIDLDVNSHQAKAPPGLEAEEFTTDWEGELPRVKTPQTLNLKETGASAAKKITFPLVTPRTTRTKRRDTGNQETDVEMRRMKIYPFLGVA